MRPAADLSFQFAWRRQKKTLHMTGDLKATHMSELVSGEGPSRILITSHIHPHSGDSRSFVSCIRLSTRHAEPCEYLGGLLTCVYMCTSPRPCANKCIQLPLSLSGELSRASLIPLVVLVYCCMWPLCYLDSKEFHSIIIQVRPTNTTGFYPWSKGQTMSFFTDYTTYLLTRVLFTLPGHAHGHAYIEIALFSNPYRSNDLDSDSQTV